MLKCFIIKLLLLLFSLTKNKCKKRKEKANQKGK